MFSTSAMTGISIIPAILSAFSTIISTSSCGVETRITPSTGMVWNTVSITSPVPGGMSMNSTSLSPQITSVQNWPTAPAMTGPRQTTGSESLSRSRFRLITSMPVLVLTGRMPASVPMAFSLMPNALGMDGPVMSASRMPTFRPWRCASTASREVTRLLPTPPLPLHTPTTFLMCDSSCGLASRLSGSMRLPQLWLQVEQSCVHSLMLMIPLFFVVRSLPQDGRKARRSCAPPRG